MKKYSGYLMTGVAIFSLNCLCAEPILYSEAVEKAKKEGADIVVLSTGSDWLPNADAVGKAFKILEDKVGNLQGKLIWAIYDDKENVSKEAQEKKEIMPSVKVWNYPAIQVLDSASRPLFFEEGVTASRITGVGNDVEKAITARKNRDFFWVDAEKTTGPAAVELIAKGLGCMPENMARSYKNEIEKMNKEDPTDAKGYHLKYTYWFLSHVEKDVNDLIDKQQHDAALALVDEKLKKPMLTVSQRQSILAGKFRILKSMGDLKNALLVLKQMIALDPKSDFSFGAKNLITYYTQPVKCTGLSWTNSDNRPEWTPMIFDLGSTLKSSGTYELEFKHKGGHTKFRNPVLKSCNNIVVGISDNKEGNTFILQVPRGGRLRLEVEGQGTGWFDGRGDVIVTKK